MITNKSKRARIAYATSFGVMWSYARLWIAGRILGEKYYESRIMALHLHNANRVKSTILELNGLFVKVGQLLSILTNFLPEAFQKPLEELQDKIPPRPFAQVTARIQKEFGKSPNELFAEFQEIPLAAASIGQAHRARLHDGTEVVVKVQHADIESIAQIDLEIIRRLTQMLSWFYQIKGMDHLYTQVRKMIEEELDFVREAESMQVISHNLADEPGIVIPKVHTDYSTMRVLTTTWHNGIKVANIHQLDDWHLDRKALAGTILHAWCRMIFKDGFYHADPHPGNLLVEQDGTLVLLDFGATGYVSNSMREGMPKLIEAAVKSDTVAIVEACQAMGFIATGHEAEEMAEKMVQALRNFLQNEVHLEGLNFKDIKVNPFNNSLYTLIQDIGISGLSGTVQVPKDYILLNRALMLLLGISTTLDDKLNPLEVVRPYLQNLLLTDKNGLLTFATNLVQGTLVNTMALPDELRQTLQKIRRGKIELRNPDQRLAAKLHFQTNRQWQMAALVILSLVATQYVSDQQDRYCYAAAVLGGVLFIKSWRASNRIYRSL